VALLIKYLFYCRHPASPFWQRCRLSRRRANQPADAMRL